MSNAAGSFLILIGLRRPVVRVAAPGQIRESHESAGKPLPTVSVCRVTTPTTRVGLVSLPEAVDHGRALRERGQLGYERLKYLRRARIR